MEMATSEISKESTSVDNMLDHEGQSLCEDMESQNDEIIESQPSETSELTASTDSVSTVEDKTDVSSADNTAVEDATTTKPEMLIALHFPRKTRNSAKPVPSKTTSKRFKKYGSRSVVWEPVLIKTEKDGKVTLTTGMKKATESQPYVPKKPSIYTQSRFASSLGTCSVYNPPQSKNSAGNSTLQTSIVSSGKVSHETVTKRYSGYLNPNINKNLGRDIAEKKASLIKEIRKVMFETASSKGTDISPTAKINPVSVGAKAAKPSILKTGEQKTSNPMNSDRLHSNSDELTESVSNSASLTSSNTESESNSCVAIEENAGGNDADTQQLLSSEPVKCVTAALSVIKGREPTLPTAQEATSAMASAYVPSSVALLPLETSTVPCVVTVQQKLEENSNVKDAKTTALCKVNEKLNTVAPIKTKQQARKSVSRKSSVGSSTKSKLPGMDSQISGFVSKQHVTVSAKKSRTSVKAQPPVTMRVQATELIQPSVTKNITATPIGNLHSTVTKSVSSALVQNIQRNAPKGEYQIMKNTQSRSANNMDSMKGTQNTSNALANSVQQNKTIQSSGSKNKQLGSLKRTQSSVGRIKNAQKSSASVTRITRAKALKKGPLKNIRISNVEGKQKFTKKQGTSTVVKKLENKEPLKNSLSNINVSSSMEKKAKASKSKKNKTEANKKTETTTQSPDGNRNKRLEKIGDLCDEMPPTESYITFAANECYLLSKMIRDTTENVENITKDLEEMTQKTNLSEYVDSETQTDAEVFLENEIDDKFEVPASTGHVLCRLCAGSFQRDALIALYGRIGSEKNLLPMINAVLPHSLKIIEMDGLPQQVCLWCADKLKSCYVILKSFMNADKTLRSVLYEQDSLHQLHTTNGQVTGLNKNHSSKQSMETPERGEKRPYTAMSPEKHDVPTSGNTHKQKKRHTMSPKQSNEVDTSTEENADIPESGFKCIDLSRLDPEYHSGFEVEWCLDEEALRSCMVPLPPDSKECSNEINTLKHDDDINTEDIESSDPFTKTTYSSKVSITKEPPIEDNSRDNLEDIFESYELEGKPVSVTQAVQVPIEESDSSVLTLASKPLKGHLQFSNEVERIDDFPQEGDEVDCSQCQILFPSKNEAFLHKVLQHRENMANITSPKQHSMGISCADGNQEEDVQKSDKLVQECTEIPAKAS